MRKHIRRDESDALSGHLWLSLHGAACEGGGCSCEGGGGDCEGGGSGACGYAPYRAGACESCETGGDSCEAQRTIV